MLPLLAIYEKIAIYLRNISQTKAYGCAPYVVQSIANLFIHLCSFFDYFTPLHLTSLFVLVVLFNCSSLFLFF